MAAVRRPSARPSPSPSPGTTDNGRVTVPKLNQDPVQSLRPLSVLVTVGSEEYEIPAMSAADWLSLLMAPEMDLADVFPGLLPDEQMEYMLFDSDLSMAEIADLATGIIATVSARSWWVALRLIDVARNSWDVIGGELTLKGVDPERLSLSSWLDVLLLVLLRNMDAKDIPMFTMRLEAPPPHLKDEVEEPTMSAEAFMAMAR